MSSVHCQGREMRAALRQLDLLWQRPDTRGFAALGANDSLTFSSHAWTVSIDPATGALPSALQHMLHWHHVQLNELHR